MRVFFFKFFFQRFLCHTKKLQLLNLFSKKTISRIEYQLKMYFNLSFSVYYYFQNFILYQIRSNSTTLRSYGKVLNFSRYLFFRQCSCFPDLLKSSIFTRYLFCRQCSCFPDLKALSKSILTAQ